MDDTENQGNAANPGGEESLRIEGEFRIRNAAAVRSMLLEKMEHAPILDLSGITEFDTAGVQILLSMKKDLDARGLSLRCSAMSEPVERVLSFYRLRDTLFAVSGGGQNSPGGEDG